jgi:hypothetical protein
MYSLVLLLPSPSALFSANRELTRMAHERKMNICPRVVGGGEGCEGRQCIMMGNPMACENKWSFLHSFFMLNVKRPS